MLQCTISLELTAKAALIGDVTFDISDDGLTDHDTGTKSDGDMLVWDSVDAKYKNLKIFDSYPGTDGSGFEPGFVIDTTNTRIGIGDDNADHELHIKKNDKPTLRIEDTRNTVKLDLWSGSSQSHIETSSDHSLVLGQEETDVISIDKDLIEMLKPTTFTGNVNVTGNVDATGNIVASGGQVYSTAATLVHSASPQMDEGNVHIATVSSGAAFTLSNPQEEVAGAMYSFVIVNSTGAPITLAIGNQYLFANGIKPNIVRANSELVISAVCLALNNLLCTWAEDFS